MAKATPRKTAPGPKVGGEIPQKQPRRGGKTAAAAAAAEEAKAAGDTVAEVRPTERKPEFSISLAKPGDDVPEGGRRFGCPDCGAKHDIVRTDAAPGQGGTWSVPDFACLAPCGYSAVSQPVT